MKRLILMTCTMLAAALPALAQTPTVDDLLAKNLASRGGAEKLKAISTRKVTGKVTVQVQMPPGAQQQPQAPPAPQTLEMPMQVLAKRPNLMLQEMRMQDRRVVTAFDGQQAWAINPMIGTSAQLLQGVQADLIRDQAQFDGPLAYARQRGDKMEVLGKEDIDGVSGVEARHHARRQDDDRLPGREDRPRAEGLGLGEPGRHAAARGERHLRLPAGRRRSWCPARCRRSSAGRRRRR